MMKVYGLYFYFVKQQNRRQIEEAESKLEDKDMNKLMFTDRPNDVSIDDSYDSLGYVFARSGEALIKRLRSKAFQAILRQDTSFFDREENSTGQKLALAGTSGCGKSTTIQLIERFYGVNMGRLKCLYRNTLFNLLAGIVSQQPVLFDMSIRENIAYGDNNRNDISLNEIIQVAKDANIQDLIQLLPNVGDYGYETMRDAHGTQLSGEQKTKNWFSSVGKFVTLVIARALIRNPKILLLDKDSENEKIAQEALDRARQNRTSITIAHRLSTIQNADIICIVHNGSMVKSGSDEELLAMGG
ncbi:unnamed protein product [Rotaria socialis]|uniref:Uncharacterized protein n=1 Tax=Rotaria socialis TaxID=392032 RepID=A0A818B8A1_9BILA|nr:unnamed protein product [Rotaria socialis]